MKQLAGKSKPKWLVLAGQMLAGCVFVAMTAQFTQIVPMINHSKFGLMAILNAD